MTEIAKSRPKPRLDTMIMLLLNNSWQGCQSLKITFEELEKVDVREIRVLLDGEDL
jgi:hypothetical protein